MSFLGNIFSNFLGKQLGRVIYRYGTDLQTLATNEVTGDPEKIATVYTCCRILSENLSRMPISVWSDNEMGRTELTRHRLAYLLKFQPNGYQNSQQFFSTIEYHRNRYGNGFALKHKDQVTGYAQSFEILHPSTWVNYEFINGELYYTFRNPVTQRDETYHSSDILHFRGLSEDGIVGLNPLEAIRRQTNINERAGATIDNFAKNNAMSPMALATELPGNLSGPGAGILKESKTNFEDNYTGPSNAGKWIHLPVGTKPYPLKIELADAELVDTLRFTREDISAAYGVLLGMVDGSFEKMDVEQLTTLFKNNTMGPIVAIYIAELNAKLLTPDELMRGFSISFDAMSLIGMDFQALVNGIKEQVVNGLMSPDEGARKLGNKPIPGDWAKKHYMQAQYIPLEDYGNYSPLQKNDPTLKTQQ